MRLRLSFVIVGAMTVATARADEGQGAAAAEALFRDGRVLLKDGKLAAACEKFAESKRLDPAPGTMVNLGRCYEDLGRTASAWATYRELAVRAAQLGQDARATFGTQKAAELEPQLATLVVDVPASNRVAGLVVQDNGLSLGVAAWGTRVPVDPGRHRISASAPGHVAWAREVDVAPAATTAIEVPTLLPLGSAEPAANEPSSNVWRTAGLATTFVGAAAAGAGLVLRGAARMDRDAAADLCAGGCSAEGRDRDRRADDLVTASTALLIGGIAFTVAGVSLLLLAPRSRSKTVASP